MRRDDSAGSTASTTTSPPPSGLISVDAWGGCAYCGQHGVPLQRDCIHPISRGGRYTLDNVVPACGSCNASKHNSEVTSWLRRKKYDERTFLLRLATIRAALLAEPTHVPPPSVNRTEFVGDS
ncbi:HNH endonuclease [Tessaracoccus sp. Y36]